MTTTTPCMLPPITVCLEERRMLPGRAARCETDAEPVPSTEFLPSVLRYFILGQCPPEYEGALAFGFCRRDFGLWVNLADGKPTEWESSENHDIELPDRAVLLLTLAARNAAIEGDHATVDAFASALLGLKRPELWRDGVIDALLGDWGNRLGRYLTDPELLAILNEYATAEHRRWQPLWDRKANGGRVRLTGFTIADGLTLGDVLPDRSTPEHLVLHHQLGDERVRGGCSAASPPTRLR
ncbi:hypothetical protein OG863_00405 [Streptomyces decoyicus]|uniref:Uncharacterized protein n=1 Tax=Streptomyces decoyicus TaxID=249567 RepID=A0ABZ1F8E5_9ACTN|nr:hypothetical protein [Streptomyces decoyicus]WSB66577.1 hypothetical protein OG863_00405 [Streptomyces decoyicus]